MIGIILTGHNHFASGVGSSIEMVGGHQDYFEKVDFPDGYSEEQLIEELQKAIDRLAECQQIVIFCDLMGGSPFRQSATLSVANPRLRVVYGVNLGMMLEFVLSRQFVEDLDETLDTLVERGREAIGRFAYQEYEADEPEDGEGI